MQHAIRHEGVTSFKMFMAYPGLGMVDDAAIFRAMRMVGQHGGMIALHAENGTIIELLIQEALAQGHTAPKYHALTRPAIMEGRGHAPRHQARRARRGAGVLRPSVGEGGAQASGRGPRPAGVPVFAETCPHYLFFDDTAYDSEDWDLARYVMSPPLRSKEPQQALWRALRIDQLQIVSTDHCPFCMKEGHLRPGEPEAARPPRFLEDPERRARCGDAHDDDCTTAVCAQTASR